ncbi:YeiH family protein [Nonomuraea roseoviolacea]|uniref:Integral membrane protein (TIGR00698 family) n=1 Tax=Nonomuraea roseoviolacea subsp. carminata TaxID=160689 RepID=A0ABT1K8X7_9ACTN|nr:putative sulfate exporter family transporter [Nonomuraea roseoviolacea]MCP2350426.1 putative integral membrane protein (TIGR00698 family) [Nonomuraea roseoviolacea subsp. carminata]
MPGLLVAAAGVAVAVTVNALVPAVSPLMVAVVLGALLGNLGARPEVLRPGLTFASGRLLRLGVVLLGARLAVPDVLALGLPVLLLVVTTVAVTFSGTWWLGTRLGLGRDPALLVATGFSICGAAAIAAMDGVTDSEKRDVMTAVALVTLYGSVAIALLPLAGGLLHLPAESFGVWAGASVQEVAQVVATAQTAGQAALATAVVVKLTRVVMLAPLIAGVSLWRRRTAGPGPRGRTPVVPLFVAGFLAVVALRSLGAVPDGWLAPIRTAETVLFTAALFAMGTAVRVRELLSTGRRAVALGAVSALLVTLVALAGVLVLV